MTCKDHALTAAVLAASAAAVAVQHGNAPATWAAGSAVVWLWYVLAATALPSHADSTPSPPLSPWDRRAVAWGVASAALFAVFATVFDPDFKRGRCVLFLWGTPPVLHLRLPVERQRVDESGDPVVVCAVGSVGGSKAGVCDTARRVAPGRGCRGA